MTYSDKLKERFIFKSNLIFDSLPDLIKDAFLGQMVIRQVKKGQNIFSEGSYPTGIYYIKKGKVKKYKALNRGKEQIIYLCKDGELLGYAAYLSDEKYSDSAAAITDATIGFISKEKLERMLDQYDELSKMLMKNLSHEFGVLVNFIATFTQKSVRERVALALLILHEKFKENDADAEVQIVLTREDFANFVGIAVETLVRLLHQFKDEQLIKKQGRKITILDKDKLLEIADVIGTFY